MFRKKCKRCPHKAACRHTKKACAYMEKMEFKVLSLEMTTNDVVKEKRSDEYNLYIDATWVMFPSGAIGQRLEVFYKKKGAKYGEIEEIGTVVIEDGRFKIIQW